MHCQIDWLDILPLGSGSCSKHIPAVGWLPKVGMLFQINQS